jgi:hypothetical protein
MSVIEVLIVSKNKLTGKKLIRKKLTPASIISKKPRKETFLASDAAYLNTRSIQLGKYINTGTRGQVYALEGNDNLVIKVANGRDNLKGIQKEANDYTEMDLYSKPFFIPTKVVQLNSTDIGLVRPRVTPIFDQHGKSNGDKLTMSQLRELRQRIIALTEEGYVLGDGLQVGVDRVGRLLLYDTDGVFRAKSGKLDFVYYTNNNEWLRFLIKIGKLPTPHGSREYFEQLDNIGQITR